MVSKTHVQIFAVFFSHIRFQVEKRERNSEGKMETDRDNGTGDEKGRKNEQREGGSRCKKEG